MQINDYKFFTNEPDRDLYSRFSKILKNNTQFFDVLVGYFRTSGFFRLYPAMEDVEKIRILVGLNVDRYTVDIIDQAQRPTLKEAAESFANEVESSMKVSYEPFVKKGKILLSSLKTGFSGGSHYGSIATAIRFRL